MLHATSEATKEQILRSKGGTLVWEGVNAREWKRKGCMRIHMPMIIRRDSGS